MSDVVQCPCTLSVHFPPTVYRSTGSAQVLPDLVKSLDIANVQCIQFVPNGIVRVTFKESAQCDAALASGVSFRGSKLRVAPVDARTRLVYLRDLPAEVPDEPVKVFLRKFGVLHSLSPQFHPGLPGVKNGTRVAKVTLVKDLPSSVRIAGFDARLWYQGQPQSCPVCRQFGHRVRDCPLNGLCRRCRQPGHMARECSSRRPSLVPDASSVADPDASSVPDVSVSDPVAGVDPAMSEDEDDPDYVPSSASEPGSCSGDEEVLRSVPTSVLAARARKRSAPPADESSDDLRDNELSPPSDPVRLSLPLPSLTLFLILFPVRLSLPLPWSPLILFPFLILFPVRLCLPLPWLFLTVRLFPSLRRGSLGLLMLLRPLFLLSLPQLSPLLPSPLLLLGLLVVRFGRLPAVLALVLLLMMVLVLLFTLTLAVFPVLLKSSLLPSSMTGLSSTFIMALVVFHTVLLLPSICLLVPRWSFLSLKSDLSSASFSDCLLFCCC